MLPTLGHDNDRSVSPVATVNALQSDPVKLLRPSSLQRGRKDGTFRDDVDATDLHLAISSYCFFRVANRYTFGALFDRDLSEPKVLAKSRQQIVDMTLAWLAAKKV